MEPQHDLEVLEKIPENYYHQEEVTCKGDFDDEKLKLFFQYAKSRVKLSPKITLEDKLYLSYYLFKKPNDELGLKAEKYWYNK